MVSLSSRYLWFYLDVSSRFLLQIFYFFLYFSIKCSSFVYFLVFSLIGDKFDESKDDNLLFDFLPLFAGLPTFNIGVF